MLINCHLILLVSVRSPPTNQKPNFKAKSPISIKNAFGNFIPAKVEVNMAHSNSNAHANNSGNVNNTNENSSNVNNKLAQVPVVLQRNASQPIDITAATNNGAFHKPTAPTVAQQLAFNKMDKKKTNRSRYDKNITFSTPVDDPVMDEDFDFEKNLALFDKQAIWDKIDANQKPDLVSVTCNPNQSALL